MLCQLEEIIAKGIMLILKGWFTVENKKNWDYDEMAARLIENRYIAIDDEMIQYMLKRRGSGRMRM